VWVVEVDPAWCDPAPMDSLVTDNRADYVWAGPYNEGTPFTAVYRVMVPEGAETDLYNFNGQLEFHIGADGPYNVSVTGNTQVEVVEGARIQGETWEAKGVILPGVTLTLDGGVSVVSSGEGVFELTAATTGTHTIVASKAGFRNQTLTIDVTDLAVTYTLNFKANSGLMPNAPDLSYVLACINKWKYPPEGLGLNLSKVLSVIHAWKLPSTEP
jgi:hypothetical protein